MNDLNEGFNTQQNTKLECKYKELPCLIWFIRVTQNNNKNFQKDWVTTVKGWNAQRSPALWGSVVQNVSGSWLRSCVWELLWNKLKSDRFSTPDLNICLLCNSAFCTETSTSPNVLCDFYLLHDNLSSLETSVLYVDYIWLWIYDNIKNMPWCYIQLTSFFVCFLAVLLWQSLK